MKTISLKRIVQALGMVALSSSAFAGTTWNMGSTCTTQTVAGTTTTNTVNGTTYKVTNVGNELNCGAGTTSTVSDVNSTLKVTAFSTASSSGTALTAGTQFATASARLYKGDGVGVVNRYEDGVSPTHTADNQNGTDALLLNFGSTKFNLSTVTIGWWANDYDITLLAYTGGGAPTVATKALATDFTASNGWTSIRNYGSAGTTTATNTGGTSGDKILLTTDNSTTYSSWWMISAYNKNYNGTNSLGTDAINDLVKFFSVVGTAEKTSNGVPEPGSLALMGAAMVGFIATRRRKQQAV